MLKKNLMTWLGVCLVGMLATAGCMSESGDESTGALDLNLELAGGAQIDEVLYQITRSGMAPMGGIIDTSAPGATASVEVFGLPEGSGYLIELRAIANGGTVCEGSAGFGVVAGRATLVGVMLNCKAQERFGSVRVNGKLNVCAELVKVVVAPLETSVGSSIDLSMQGVDAEGDLIRYSWSSTGGFVDNPEASVTRYTCTSEGTQTIFAAVTDDDFGPCVDTWQVEVRCGTGDGGTGGSGGSGGTGGTGGTGGGVPACLPELPSCSNGNIEPIVEDPACMLNEPPVLADGCAGNESLINPSSCTPLGNESTHEVQLIAIDGDCNSGFDLDSCSGTSCRRGGLAPGEGVDGVDNALAGLAPVVTTVGGNLGGVDQVLYDGLCDGSISWVFIVDPNSAESCINVTPIYGGVQAEAIPLNLSETGCISGTLGTIPLPVAGVQGQLDNAVVRGTGDVTQGFNVTLGATVEDETAKAIAEALIEGGSAVVAQVFDMRSDLQGDVATSCDSISLSLDVGGTLVGGTNEGFCTDSANAAVYANLVYTDANGLTSTGTDAAAAIGGDCIFGSAQSDPVLEGCGSEAGSVISCFPNCASEIVFALADCVAECTQDATAEASPPGLSNACVACTGDIVACGAAFCTNLCVSDVNAPGCIACRCDNECIPTFTACSGIPDDTCN
ncbi:MAG: hypothetical protein WBN10_07110 [Polyangiales bacterium]